MARRVGAKVSLEKNFVHVLATFFGGCNLLYFFGFDACRCLHSVCVLCLQVESKVQNLSKPLSMLFMLGRGDVAVMPEGLRLSEA